ncbi:hypothetical protein CLAIMM_05895 isoform 2 [Cladophialophora immunda]|nr:hypothetical protein CLAIMM_05895 isoform 2 [Cladophialophora immunda]
MPPLPIEEYQVGWVCALPKELTAARAMLDEEYEPYTSQIPHDNNSYVLGRMHGHNVVMACLPAGVYGTVSAATVANNMLRTFTGIRFGLMVGIGGGIPNVHKDVDIRLGDVVVSQPDGTHGGVVQYDLRKNLGEGVFERKGVLRPPPTLLLTALTNLQSQHQIHGNQISGTLSTMIQRSPRLAKVGYMHPGPEKDVLYCSNVEGHREGNYCTQCLNGIIDRKPREDQSPKVHYGVIASGNELIKNVVERDRLGREFGAKCVEMEAAGLMNDFPYIIVRGICDYADSKKNDVWQEYAAVTAAGFAKELLATIKPAAVISIKQATEAMKYNRGLNLYDAPDMDVNLFIGRQTEIQQMESILQPQLDTLGSSRKVLVLGGMGGIGKTQLSITYAKQHRTCYTSIFWLNAASEVGVKSSMRNVAYRVLPPEMASTLDDEQAVIHVSNWLSEQDNTRWLLIFDNYDDPDQYSLDKYFPFVAHGSVIVTTRLPDRVRGEQVRVRSMSKEDDSLRVLATRSGRGNVESDADARQLARRLDGHPLALATAGAFLGQSSVSFGQYLRQYEARWRVIDSMEELSDYPSRTLYSTWNLSFTRIEQENPRAAELLRFLAYFDHQDIWFELLHRGRRAQISWWSKILYGDQREHQPTWFSELASDKFMFEEAMRLLTRYGLVETHYQTGSYSLHMCVHDWALDGLNHQIDARQYWLAFDCVAGHFSVDDLDHLSTARYRRFTGHAKRLVHNRFQTTACQQSSIGSRLNSMVTLADVLQQQVQYDAAEKMYMRVLAWCEKALGVDHPSTLETVNNLGNLYVNQGKLVDAEGMYMRALAGKEKALGVNHPSTLDTVNNLGNLCVNQGKLDEAKVMYMRALAGYEKALGVDHPSTLDTVNNLGLLYVNQGKLDEAKVMYMRALAGYEKALGVDHPSTLDTVNNLGNLCVNQGKLDEAKVMYMRALAGYEKALGVDHPSTLDTVHNLGLLSQHQDKLDEAEAMYMRALTGREKALGVNHPSTLDTVNNLGILYANQGKLVDAEGMYVRALAGKEKALGVNHMSTLGTVGNLGNLYRDQGKLVEAEAIYLRALAGYEKALGVEHPSTLDTINNLGGLFANQGKLVEAEAMFKRALAGKEKAVGVEHTSTLASVQNLGNVYRDQGKLVEAEVMYMRALAGYKKALGSNHMSTLLVSMDIGTLLCLQWELSKAERTYQDAISGLRRVLGPDHIHTLGTVNNLANLYCEQSKMVEAERLYEQALVGITSALGQHHYFVWGVTNNRGLLLAEQGSSDVARRMYQEAQAGYERSLGPGHPHTKMVCYNLRQLELTEVQAGARVTNSVEQVCRRWYY